MAIDWGDFWAGLTIVIIFMFTLTFVADNLLRWYYRNPINLIQTTNEAIRSVGLGIVLYSIMRFLFYFVDFIQKKPRIL